MDLRSRRCTPCEGGVPALEPTEAERLLGSLHGWTIRDGRLTRTFRFRDFVTAMQFVNRMAEVAEAENHHPDFCVHYREVEVTIWTHAIGGLSENDFILAAKIEVL